MKPLDACDNVLTARGDVCLGGAILPRQALGVTASTFIVTVYALQKLRQIILIALWR